MCRPNNLCCTGEDPSGSSCRTHRTKKKKPMKQLLTQPKVLEYKADLATGGALSASLTTYSTSIQGLLEWGVLILGFISGAFALYWNVLKFIEHRRRKRNERSK